MTKTVTDTQKVECARLGGESMSQCGAWGESVRQEKFVSDEANGWVSNKGGCVKPATHTSVVFSPKKCLCGDKILSAVDIRDWRKNLSYCTDDAKKCFQCIIKGANMQCSVPGPHPQYVASTNCLNLKFTVSDPRVTVTMVGLLVHLMMSAIEMQNSLKHQLRCF